ncbi:MAG: excinuclease ABC subunit A, partial [Paramuribaculum sp.]|nr:excinuclease ABC subunit A [Paramuribaculum sp.]
MTKKLSKIHIAPEAIRAVNVRVNNLKNVNLTLDRNRFVVITGVSGSGKSSLAFDTLYAEGRRRYVESLSAYARQFMGKMAKPECDMIKGLPPAIAIEQKVNTRNPRSTVGTATEIYDYLRLLFGRVGRTISPISSTEVKKHSVADVTARAIEYGEGTRVAIASPLYLPEGREFASQLNVLLKGGYSRLVDSSNHFISITDLLDKAEAGQPLPDPSQLLLLIDRLAVATEGDELSRMADSAETAFFEGHGECVLIVWTGDGATVSHIFSNRFEADGMTFREPSDQMFNFNNPYGACPRCEGLGRTVGIDEQLVVPDPTKSIYDDAVVCWRGEKMSEWKQRLILMADRIGFPIHRPYASLTPAEKDILWHGKGSWDGIDGFFRMVEENQYKIQYRVMLSRYRGKTICPDCHGSRLAPDALYVEVGGMTIDRIVNMPVSKLIDFFNNLSLSGNDLKIAKRLLDEIKSRLTFLMEVGLGYLTLNRLSSTLSGGESQRINLATSLGSSLVGSLYILDEPSIGLHSRDTDRLIKVLRRLQSIGNTVVVVEHDEDIMRAADEIVDVGPLAGRLGGEIVYTGPVVPSADVEAPANSSLTLHYLDGSLSIPVPKSRRKWRDYIQVEGARQHNLKDLTVKFPLGVMTVVTGVSGSGKSTLVRDILYRALVRHLGEAGDAPGAFTKLSGSLSMIRGVEFIDQNSIGRSSRSNPATYL